MGIDQRRPIAERSTLELVRWIAVFATVYLTLGMLWLLTAPGYSTTRLVLVLAVLGFAWAGAIGAVQKRFRPVISGAAGLVVLGFWEAVLWVFMLPTAVVFGVVGVLMWRSGDARL